MNEETTEYRAEPQFKVGDDVLVRGHITKINKDYPYFPIIVDFGSTDPFSVSKSRIHSLAPKEPVEVVAGSATSEKVVRFSAEEYKIGDVVLARNNSKHRYETGVITQITTQNGEYKYYVQFPVRPPMGWSN